MLLPFWCEVTFDFDSPKNHWLFSVSDDAPEEKASCDRHKPKENKIQSSENPRFIGISLAVVSVAEVSLAVWR